MPAKVSCFCGKRMTVNEDLRGRKIRCPACDEILVVPGHSTANYEEESWEHGSGTQHSGRTNQTNRGREYGAEYGNRGISPMMWIAVGSVALALLVLVVTLVTIRGNKAKDNSEPTEIAHRAVDRTTDKNENGIRKNRPGNRNATDRRTKRTVSKTKEDNWPTRSWAIGRNYKTSLARQSQLTIAPKYAISVAKLLGRMRLSESGTASVLIWSENQNRTNPGAVVILSIDELPDSKKNISLSRPDIESRVKKLHATHRQFQMEKVEMGRIHGMEFARIYWDSAGLAKPPRKPVRGVDYLSSDGSKVVHISASDQSRKPPKNLFIVEAMIQSFDRNPLYVKKDKTSDEGNRKTSPEKTVRLVPVSPVTEEKKTTKDATEWSSQNKQSGSGWGADQPSVRIPLPLTHNTKVFYSIGSNPYVLIGQTVFDPRTGKQLGIVPIDEENRNLVAAVSSDGKLVAVGSSEMAEKLTFYIYETSTGKRKTTIEFTPKKKRTRRGKKKDEDDKPVIPPVKLRLNFLRFVGERKLLASMWRETVVLDLVTGKVSRPLKIKFSPREGEFTFSNDGKLMAAASHSGVFVYNLQTGRAIASMASPMGPDGKYMRMFFCQGLAFSQNNEELAAWFHGRIVVWNKKTKVVYNVPVSSSRGFGNQKQFSLQWLPDNSGWVLAGREIFDRERKIKILRFESPSFYGDIPHRFIDNERLMVARTIAGNSEMAALKLPWESIKSVRKMLDSDAAPHIGPGQKVSIEVKVGKVFHTSQKQVSLKLKDALTKRLKEFDIEVADSQETTFTIDYSEELGRMLKIVEGGIGFGFFGGRDSGRRVQETVGKVIISLTVPNESQPLWKWEMKNKAGRIAHGELTPAGLRKEMFEWIESRVKSTDLPRYISKEKNAPRLPIIVNLGGRR